MFYQLLPVLAGICSLSVNNLSVINESAPAAAVSTTSSASLKNVLSIGFQEKPGPGRIAAITFRSQDYCRVELKDFEFDVTFSVVSVDVYFSGTNFKAIEKSTIKSNSLKPLKSIMARCTAGTIVTFDNVKVKGPDNEIRTIEGINLQLY